MKIKSLMTMTMAAVAFVMSMSSCSSSDDEPEVAVATQVAGTYTGEEIMTVMGEVFNGTATYAFVKSTDTSLDMTIPASSGGTMNMNIPALPVKNITLTKSGNTITGKLASYTGTATNADGKEKSFTVSDLTAIFDNKAVVVTYTLKYGNMPFSFSGAFSGTKQ